MAEWLEVVKFSVKQRLNTSCLGREESLRGAGGKDSVLGEEREAEGTS